MEYVFQAAVDSYIDEEIAKDIKSGVIVPIPVAYNYDCNITRSTTALMHMPGK
jgi:hypothetical protein